MSPARLDPAPATGPMTRAGTPMASIPGGTSRVTTLPAPTMAPSPIVTPHTMVALAPTLARRPTLVVTNVQSASVSSSPSAPTARGRRSFVKQACGPMKAPSSIVTPDGMKANGRTLTLRPRVTPLWISTNEAILQPSPIEHPYRLTSSGCGMTTSRPSWTSLAIKGGASGGDGETLVCRARHRGRHALDGLVGQLRVHRERDDLIGGFFRGREIAAPVAEVGVRGLEVDGDRVV